MLAALLSVGIAVLSLIGWAFDIAVLRSVRASWATMKPITALCLIMVGTGLLLNMDRVLPRVRASLKRTVATVLGSAVVLTTGAIMLQYATHGDWGLSLWIAKPFIIPADVPLGTRTNVWAPVMAASPANTIAQMLLGLSVALMNVRLRLPINLCELLAVPPIIVGATAVMAYAFDSDALYRFHPYSSMALNSSVALVLLGAGCLAARPDQGAVALIAGDNAGGRVARRLLPATVAAPIVMGAWSLALERAGMIGSTVAAVLLSIGNSTVLCGAVVIVAYPLARADSEQKRGLARQRLMMSELDHRVKNTLAAILSLADLTMMTTSSMESFSKTFGGRIRAMARTHEALASKRWEGVDLAELVALTVAPISNQRLNAHGPDVLVPSRASSPLCMALHELGTNAAKYGAIHQPAGRIEIIWEVSEDQVLTIHWRESGVPGICTPSRIGFGTELIRGAIAHELGGSVGMSYEPPGFGCSMTIPLAPLREAQSLVTAGLGRKKEVA